MSTVPFSTSRTKANSPDSHQNGMSALHPVSVQETALTEALPRMSTRQKRKVSYIDSADVDDARPAKKARRDTCPSLPAPGSHRAAANLQADAAPTRKGLTGKPVDADPNRRLRAALEAGKVGSAVKAVMLKGAASRGALAQFDLLLEFGALEDWNTQILAKSIPRRPTLLECLIHGQNWRLLKSLEAVDVPLCERSPTELGQALILAASRGGIEMIGCLCSAADAQGIRWDAAWMADFFAAAIRVINNKSYHYALDYPVISYFEERYPHSIDASVYSKALIAATMENNWNGVSVLLGVYRADAESVTHDGVSLLMETAAAGKSALYELLRFHDASPHAVDDQGNSVLHHAVRGGNEAIVLDLVSKCKVDVSVANNDGDTALQLATSLNREYIRDIIAFLPGIPDTAL